MISMIGIVHIYLPRNYMVNVIFQYNEYAIRIYMRFGNIYDESRLSIVEMTELVRCCYMNGWTLKIEQQLIELLLD